MHLCLSVEVAISQKKRSRIQITINEIKMKYNIVNLHLYGLTNNKNTHLIHKISWILSREFSIFPINTYQFDDTETPPYIRGPHRHILINNQISATMTSRANALKRIMKDLEKVDPEDPGYIINADEKDLFNLTALIAGPQGTIWQGGMFELAFTFTEQYPVKCPKVVFKSKMFHPNIYHDGRICLDLLGNQWAPIYDIMSILVSIRSLLNHPNINAPANEEASKVYASNMYEYERKVREIVELSQAEEMEEE